MRILVIDDHAELLADIQKFLLSAAHQVLTAASAEEAMGIVDTDRNFDVVVTDIAMPGMNGIEMWSKMCPNLPSAKVIFISSANNSFLQRYLPGSFLPKPFKMEQLHQEILTPRAGAGSPEQRVTG